jgi:hypothetical protein
MHVDSDSDEDNFQFQYACLHYYHGI